MAAEKFKRFHVSFRASCGFNATEGMTEESIRGSMHEQFREIGVEIEITDVHAAEECIDPRYHDIDMTRPN